MRGTVLYGTGDIRFEDSPEPKITKPTDAIIRLAATMAVIEGVFARMRRP